MSNPSPDTAMKVQAVLELIETGTSEHAACQEIGLARGTFRSAVLRFNLADVYARATEALARDQVEKLETTIQEMRDGAVSPEIGRIEIDARKWIASKLFKPTWGDKVVQEHQGEVAVNHTLDLSSLTDEQLRVLATISPAKA